MPDEKLTKLKELLNIINSGLTREDFVKSFKSITDHILRLEKKLIEKINLKVDQSITQIEKTGNDVQSEISKIKEGFTKTINKALKDQEDGMNFIRDKARMIKNGKDADEKKIVKRVLAQIPEPKEETSETLANKLEALKGDARLKIEAVLNLEERLKMLEERPIGRGGVMGGGVGKLALEAKFVDDETPSGTVNGTNTDFVLAHTPLPPSSLKVFVNGMRMRITEDYTLLSRTITFLTAPPTGSILLVDYRK